MVVIVEGIDGVGKTTLCKAFSQKYKYKYIKESYTEDKKEKQQRMYRMTRRLLSNSNFIYDRTTLIDDFVYGFLNKKESPLQKSRKYIYNVLSKCKIIHIVIDEEIRKKRFEERGDEYITEKDIDKISENYFKFYENLDNVKVLTITENTNRNIRKLMEAIND